MSEKKRRGLDDLISQKPTNVQERNAEQTDHRYTKTVGFKVTDRQYDTYRLYSKYYGPDELIEKWRSDLEKIAQEKGQELENVETEIRKRLNK
jgi:vacuolar-type H+-ATPase subunit I/STV1